MYAQGERASHVYIVASGDFEVIRTNTLIKKVDPNHKNMAINKIKSRLGPDLANHHT